MQSKLSAARGSESSRLSPLLTREPTPVAAGEEWPPFLTSRNTSNSASDDGAPILSGGGAKCAVHREAERLPLEKVEQCLMQEKGYLWRG
jgi:hypothetical protein